MNDHNHARMTATGGSVALTRASIEVDWNGLVAAGRITQHYRNPESHPVEIAYTFPMGWKAVLLDVEVTIGERRLRARVAERKVAEATYENAIADGDSPVLIQQVRPGIYTLNLGNLLSGEEARVSIRWSEFSLWRGGEAMLRVPTTLAPRYGDPSADGFAPHQVPIHDTLVEYPLEVTVRVSGPAARGRLASPTHRISTRADAGLVTVDVDGRAFLDRDFTLVSAGTHWASGYTLTAPDPVSGKHVAAAVFRPLEADALSGPRDIRFVVDCSGSMAGDSIAQAKRALAEFVVSLKDDDTFNVIAFGSSSRALFERAQVASANAKAHAAAFANSLEADLGGTEMEAALRAAAVGARPDGTEFVLITDGEVHGLATTAEWLARRHVRVFGVGVGAAPAEDVVRSLAETTGGGFEFVTPNDDMGAAVTRHVARLSAPPVAELAVTWEGATPLWHWRDARGTPSASDSLIEAVALDATPDGTPVLTCALDGVPASATAGEVVPLPADWQGVNLLPRLVSGLRLREMLADQAATLAVRYQIICQHASAVLVHERAADAKGDAVPALSMVPQMLAAGHQGTGSVRPLAMVAEIGDSPLDLSFEEDSPSWQPGIRMGMVLPNRERGRLKEPPPPPPSHALTLLVELARSGRTPLAPDRAADLLRATDLSAEAETMLAGTEHLGVDRALMALIALGRLLDWCEAGGLDAEISRRFKPLRQLAREMQAALVDLRDSAKALTNAINPHARLLVPMLAKRDVSATTDLQQKLDQAVARLETFWSIANRRIEQVDPAEPHRRTQVA